MNNVYVTAVGNRDPDDLRQNASALFPPEYYMNYLSIPEVMSEIGAETTYQECPDPPYSLFTRTGDVCRLKVSAANSLSELMNGYSTDRTLVASAAFRVGEFWTESSSLGM